MRLLIASILLVVGCATPRSNLILGLDFSEQKPESLIYAVCNGVKKTYVGGFACEEKTPRQADIYVKIMPLPGRIVYSNGIEKKVEDFNYGEKGFWIWKKKVINTTWVKLDIGELSSLYGDVPISLDVIGYSDKSGVIVNRGIMYHRICNDSDIPCSKLVIHFDCVDEIKNTFTGQLGFCNRMSGSRQSFRLPIKGPTYTLKEGAVLVVRGGRSGWTHEHKVAAEEVTAGEYKFFYPMVMRGPELFSFAVGQREQGVWTEYHTSIVISGFSEKWTGIDKPHLIKDGSHMKICRPVTSDLLEVSEGSKIKYTESDTCIKWTDSINVNVCAFASDRESSGHSHTCFDKNFKESGLD